MDGACGSAHGPSGVRSRRRAPEPEGRLSIWELSVIVARTQAVRRRLSMATPQVGDRLEKRSRQFQEQLPWIKDGHLRAFLAIMHTSGENAAADYAQALEFFRREPESTMIAITGGYSASPERAYTRRHALVQAAVALEDEAALAFLADVVLSPIPPEGMPDAQNFSTVAEETIIRMSAVDGIAVIARAGAGRAIETLISFLTIPSFSIRRAAVMGVLGARGGAKHRPRGCRALYHRISISSSR